MDELTPADVYREWLAHTQERRAKMESASVRRIDDQNVEKYIKGRLLELSEAKHGDQ